MIGRYRPPPPLSGRDGRAANHHRPLGGLALRVALGVVGLLTATLVRGRRAAARHSADTHPTCDDAPPAG